MAVYIYKLQFKPCRLELWPPGDQIHQEAMEEHKSLNVCQAGGRKRYFLSSFPFSVFAYSSPTYHIKYTMMSYLYSYTSDKCNELLVFILIFFPSCLSYSKKRCQKHSKILWKSLERKDTRFNRAWPIYIKGPLSSLFVYLNGHRHQCGLSRGCSALGTKVQRKQSL